MKIYLTSPDIDHEDGLGDIPAGDVPAFLRALGEMTVSICGNEYKPGERNMETTLFVERSESPEIVISITYALED